MAERSPLYEKYVGRSRDDFATLEDLQKNYKVTVGDDFRLITSGNRFPYARFTARNPAFEDGSRRDTQRM